MEKKKIGSIKNDSTQAHSPFSISTRLMDQQEVLHVKLETKDSRLAWGFQAVFFQYFPGLSELL